MLMPSRNVVKEFVEDAYYHIYNRGIDDREIFCDDQDYAMFLQLLKRHLSREQHKSDRGAVYETFAGRVELQAYCLMPTHFHLLIYLNNDKRAIANLLRRVFGAYTTYYNKKYQRSGPLFQGPYKAARIEKQEHLVHVTRFIHRNHDDYYNWPHSSLQYYIGDLKTDWVVPDRVYRLYEWGAYEKILNDHSGHVSAHDLIAPLLAHSSKQ
jgi:putative transposase